MSKFFFGILDQQADKFKKRFIDEQIIFAELRWLRVLGEYRTVIERMPDQKNSGYGRSSCVPRCSLFEVISHRSREGLERLKWAAVRCLQALLAVSSRVLNKYGS